MDKLIAYKASSENVQTHKTKKQLQEELRISKNLVEELVTCLNENGIPLPASYKEFVQFHKRKITNESDPQESDPQPKKTKITQKKASSEASMAELAARELSKVFQESPAETEERSMEGNPSMYTHSINLSSDVR